MLPEQPNTYNIAINRCSILSISINDLAAWIIFLLAVWLTHGAPNKRLIIPRLNHCDLACRSNTSSNKFNADVNAGYSDDCYKDVGSVNFGILNFFTFHHSHL